MTCGLEGQKHMAVDNYLFAASLGWRPTFARFDDVSQWRWQSARVALAMLDRWLRERGTLAWHR